MGQCTAVQLFREKGQKFLHCPRTKEQRDKLKILPRDRTGWDSLPKSGTGQYEILTTCPVPRDKTRQSRKGCFKPGKGSSKTEKDVLKHLYQKFFCLVYSQ